MIAREAMTSPVVTVPRAASVRQAVRLLYENELTTAPVVDETGRMVGVVSEMDLLRGEHEADPRSFPLPGAASDRPTLRVEDVMTTGVRTARESTDLAELAKIMISTGVKGVPVLRADRLVGIVSRRDLMRMMLAHSDSRHSDARVRDDVLVAIRDCFPSGPRWTVTVSAGVVRLEGRADRHAARAVDVLARTVPGVARVAVVDAPNGA
jgi:CBS domain-containing protein